MSSVLQDLRFAFRALRKSPGFTTVAVLTLALGIGANTAMFSVVYGILLRPLPYPEPQRIVALAQSSQGDRGVLPVTYAEFRFLEQYRTDVQYLAASTPVGVNLFAGDAAERVHALRVSRDYFRVLGVAPALGRAFTAAEDQPGGPDVAILSHDLWVRRFAADPHVLRRTIQLDGHPATVVGVMPAGFAAAHASAVDLWSTLAQVGRSIGAGENLEVVGRLEPGTTLARAREAMRTLTAPFQERFHEQEIRRMGRMDLVPYRALASAAFARPLQILFGAIAFVLLIACANVANLVLARAAVRERDVAVRVALGAGRWQLARSILAESVLLALAGGTLGVLLASWALKGVLAIVPAALPGSAGIGLDGWALGFTVGLSIVTGILFGLLPAWRAAHSDVQRVLKDGGGRSGVSPRRGRLRGGLVVGEVALSLVLLVGAGLLLRTFANLMRDDVGFRPDHLLTAEIWLNGTRYDSTADASLLYDALTRRLDALPGVRAAGVVEEGLPFQRGGNLGWVRLDGATVRSTVQGRTVTPDYLSVLGVPLLRGRRFTSGDNGTAQPVALVNRTFARRLLSDSQAIGHSIRISSGETRRIVGVVGDVTARIGEPAFPTVFIPAAQTPIGMTRLFSNWFPIHVVLRTAVEPAALEDAVARAIRETDPAVPVGRVRTMDEVRGAALAFTRFIMLLLAVFASAAVALAAVGIYGVVSYFAAGRMHEIGVRMALGAVPSNAITLVLGRGMLLVAIGSVLGVAGAVALTRLLTSQLYGVAPRDLKTFVLASLTLIAVAFLATYLPARRATRIDPVEALRSE